MEEIYMKKKFKSALLATLLSLSIVSCQKANNSSSLPDSSKPSISTPDKPSSSSSLPSSTPIEKPESSSSSSLSIYDTTKWSRSTVDLMLAHLGGQIIPYMELPRDVTCEYEYDSKCNDTGHILFSTITTLSQEQIATIRQDYTTAGYNVVPASGGFVFTKGTLHVALKQSNADGLAITVNYNEPYATTEEEKAGFWDADMLAEITAGCHQHPLPFFYLGTTQNYYYEYDQEKSTITIVGQTFQDAYLTDIAKSFQDHGVTSIEAEESSVSGILAFDDGCQYSLKADSTSRNSIKRCRLVATFKESFDPNRYDDWSNEIKADLSSEFDNHSIPFVYLGNDTPEHSFSSSSETATLKGKEWDPLCVSNAIEVFKKANWTTVGEDKATSIAREIVEEDGCVLHAEVFQSTSNLCTMTIHIVRAMPIPDTATAWSEETVTNMNTYLKNQIPYVYLNLATLDNPIETSRYYSRYHTLNINGGYYNDNILTNAKKTFDNDHWTTSYKKDGDFFATKTFTKKAEDGSALEGDGETLEVTIDKKTSYTSKSVIEIRRKEVFDATSQKDWSDDVKKDLNKIASAKDFPFVYLGTAATDYYSSCDTRNMIVTVNGNTWNDSILDAFKTAYTAKEGADISYTVTQDEKNPTSLTATGVNSDGQTFTVTLKKDDSDDCPVMTFKASYNFDPNNAPTEWPEEIKKGIADNLSADVSLPVIYLGTQKPTGSYNSSVSGYSITGGPFDRRVLPLAKTKLEAEGWMVQENYTGVYGKALAAYKVFAKGTLRVVIAANGSDSNSKAFMQVYYDAAITPDDASTLAYSDDQKTTIQGAVGEDLPYIFPKGIKTVAASKATSTPSYCLKMTPATTYNKTNPFNFNNLLYAKDKLEKEHPEYKVELTLIPNDSSSHLGHGNARLVATKTLTDGSKIVFTYGYQSTPNTSAPAIFVSHHTGLTNVNNITDWDTKTATNMNYYAGFVLPYFYIGADEVKNSYYSSSNRWMNFTGGYYDDSMVQGFKDAFTKDTAHTWTLEHSNRRLVDITSSGYGGSSPYWVQAEVAKTTLDDGTVIEVAFYEKTSQAMARSGYSIAAFNLSIH